LKNILVSDCLLGSRVRYDGNHCSLGKSKIHLLKENFNIIAICPEVMSGMSVPREPIEIKNSKVIKQDQTDITSSFDRVFKYLENLLNEKDIKYAVLKDFSPSCGSTFIYDGSFSGVKIPGNGLITSYLKKQNVEIFNEDNLDELFQKYGIALK
jgi:uncharacterized protein YbbK (DUF523 family)